MTNTTYESSRSSLARKITKSALIFLLAVLALVMTIGQAGAQTYTVLYSFAGPPDGANPTASLLLGSGGTLFGTTQFGGPGDCALGCGVVFRLGKKGKETILHTFDGSSADGAIPQFGLVRDSAGNMYGTTAGGGNNNVGTVYEINAAGKETVLYKFTGNPASDGGGPAGLLALDKAGNLYGTTVIGGGIGHQGTVFKVDSAGTETVLYSFTGGTDGSAPYAGVIRDAAGNLYGTTYAAAHLTRERCSGCRQRAKRKPCTASPEAPTALILEQV